MRLFEYQGGIIPDLRQYLTPQLIDDIIRDGKWVSHGSDLKDWHATSCYCSDYAEQEGFDASLEELPYAEAVKHPDFRRCVEHWLDNATEQFENTLRDGCEDDNVAPYGPLLFLYRCMAVRPEWFNNPIPKMGIFWSAVPNQARRFIKSPPKSYINILMRVHVKNISVNWYETLRSRLDYDNGEEHEFQLNHGSSLGPVEITLINDTPSLPKTSTRTGTA